jgi:hypothetical protein
MTPFLILTRAAIIGWTTLAVFPLEMAFDVIEGELSGEVSSRERDASLSVGSRSISARGRSVEQPLHHCLD